MNSVDNKRPLAAALGRIPSGIFILTARSGELETGMVASWIQQCSFHPPQISLAMNRERTLSTWLTEGALFAINILDESQTDMIGHFGRGFAPGEPAFEKVETRRLDKGLLILEEALAYLECQVVGRFPAGDHDLLVGQIIDGQLLSEGHPMVHIRKSGMHY